MHLNRRTPEMTHVYSNTYFPLNTHNQQITHLDTNIGYGLPGGSQPDGTLLFQCGIVYTHTINCTSLKLKVSSNER